MSEWWEQWKGWLLEVSLILGAAAVIVTFFEDVRKRVKSAGKGFLWLVKLLFSPLIAPFYLMRQAKIDQKERAALRAMVEDGFVEAKEDRGDLRRKFESLSNEFVFNGGSTLRDQVALMESHRQESFWLQSFPAFECLPDGRNVLVSEPYLVLTSVRMDDELGEMDWGQFIYAEDLPGYLKAWREASAAGTVFRQRARWTNRLREDCGLWEVRATPIRAMGAMVHGQGSICIANPKPVRKVLRYRGRLIPVDDVAKGIAAREGWVWPGM